MVISVGYDDSVDRSISTASSTECSLDTMPQHVPMAKKDSYYYASSIYLRAEISKFTILVGSANFSSLSYGSLSDESEPTFFNLTTMILVPLLP